MLRTPRDADAHAVLEFECPASCTLEWIPAQTVKGVASSHHPQESEALSAA